VNLRVLARVDVAPFPCHNPFIHITYPFVSKFESAGSQGSREMPKASKEQSQLNHERVADAAARLYRERGFQGVGVAEIMAEAGMTAGAFHSKFGSKEALADEACLRAFEQVESVWQAAISQAERPTDAFEPLIDAYLSIEHRNTPAYGCVISTLATDVSRLPEDNVLRETFNAGVRRALDAVASVLPPELDDESRRQRAVVTYATLVGAMVISRAVSDEPLATEMIERCRESIKLPEQDA
jgi:TetR/AcrR family transcriptional regulator, transcriptional repressor for nem operon